MARRVRGQLLEALLDGLPEACLGIDRSGRVRFLNRSARELLELDRDLDVIDQEVWNALPRSDFSRLLGSAVKAVQSQLLEQVQAFPGGRVCLVQIIPVDSEDGRLQGWTVYLRDMSAVKKLEQGLEQFLVDINQQLKLPLTAIKGYVETLLEGAYQSPEVTRRFLQVINEETNRLTRLVVSLEEASAPSAPKSALVAIDLVSLLRELVTLFSQVAAEKKVALQVDVPGHLAPVRVRPQDFRKALINLLDNAVKCTGLKGGGTVTMAVIARRSAIEIQVADTGVGIAAEELERIFEKFYRVKQGLAAELGGTGLGLSVVREVVHDLGGKVGVTSSVGEGSTFTVTLPA